MESGRLQDRLGRPSKSAIDVLVIAAVAAAMTLTISVAQEEDATRSPDVLAYLLGLTVPALLLVRRRYAVLVLLGSVGVLLIYFGMNYPAFSPAVPLAAASYSAAVSGKLLPAAAIDGALLVFGAGWQILEEDTSLASVVGTGTLADAALLASVLLLGEAVRNRRAWSEEVRQRLQRVSEDREREAARRIEEERLRIARELHDVVAHTIATVNVQAGVATDVIDQAPDQARASLSIIREQSREAMAELRATVGLLRGRADDAPRAPAPGLEGLDGVVQSATAAGLEVAVRVGGVVRPLPVAIDLTAYRIVQESLTNILRHANATTAGVLIRYEPSAVVVDVRDDGRGLNGSGDHDGYGLVGMRERAAAVGGTLGAGPAPGGGFRVHARLPTSRDPG